ncbi:MFS transporter [Actibacterium sp. 188UL27-1]|uniref:MFS transporter n=1 Tax=Actibacterium sp. 188UL27-1 TaxID=2786961 RepID=UPI0019597228|nr:MFS transporter [Actibacterium sp. 188UL27-1]MBM7066190.1 MFS transporter [Actibacterium sp. 188UL27-1]
MGRSSTLYISRKPATAFVVMGLCWGAFAAYVPQIKASVGVGDALFGAVLSMASLGLIAAMWVAPPLDVRLGRRGIAVASVILGTAFLLPGLSYNPVFLGVAMLAVALASGLADILMNARVSELEARHKRSLMNFNHAMFSFAYAGGAVFSGIGRAFETPPIAIFGLLWVVILGLSLAMQTPRSPRRKEGEARPGLPLGIIIPGGLIVLLAFMVEGATDTWSALHIERTLAGAPTEGALGPAMLGLTMGIGRYAGQVLSNRMRDSVLLSGAALLTALGAGIAALASEPWVAYLGFGTLGLGVSVIAPTALALTGRRIPRQDRTVAIARVSVIGFSGFFVGPPIMGLVSEFSSLRYSFAAMGVLILLVLPLLIPLRRI